MQANDIDPTALGFTVVSLSVALEETLKALAAKNGNQLGPWFDEVQDLALFRAQGRLSGAKQTDAAATAIAVVETIFTRLRSAYPSS